MPEKLPKRKFFVMLVRDAAFCACFIYFALQAIQLIPVNSDWFQPASNAFKDFDWGDIYFSNIKNLKTNNPPSSEIMVINVNKGSREDIGRTLLKLNTSGAKVIGLDVLFKDTTKGKAGDDLLDSSINVCGKKIIIACYADSAQGNSIYSIEPLTVPRLGDYDNLGYVNFIGDENYTIRSYYKVQDFRNRKMSSFAFNTFIKYNDKGDFNSYKDEFSDDETLIPYQSLPEHFYTVDIDEVLDSMFNLSIFNDKIILIGFTGTSDGFTVIDDKHFTPLNENYAGKAIPDMFGIYMHANIIEGFIDNYKIRTPSAISQILAGILFIFLFLIPYLFSESREHNWHTLVEISLQLLFGFIIVILAIYFLSYRGIKWNIGETIAAIALAEPFVAIYTIILNYLAKVYHFNSIFLNED